MKISYAVTVCKELKEIQRLISFLAEGKRDEDEIVVLFDNKNGFQEIYEWLESNNINVTSDSFDGHFGDWKNKLTSLCSGDYIFQIDADEVPNPLLLANLPDILESNDVDVILVPRVNTVDGLTQDHIQKWGWNVNDQGWVNWPDPQWRIYKNKESIRWVNKVHERLEGYDTISNLPWMAELSLFHDKTIERQEQQNNYYDTLS